MRWCESFNAIFWRYTAAVIGLLVFFPTIYLGYTEVNATEQWNIDPVFLSALILNICSCISWMWGIIKSNKLFMVVSLIYWTILLSWVIVAWFYTTVFLAIVFRNNYDNWIFDCAIVFYMIAYIVAVISCTLMNRSTRQRASEIPEYVASYGAPEEKYALNPA